MLTECTDPDTIERDPVAGTRYTAFAVEADDGLLTLAIAHNTYDRTLVDLAHEHITDAAAMQRQNVTTYPRSAAPRPKVKASRLIFYKRFSVRS